ncbi:hypothetical protein BS50DRAFT_567632 [Corynespora cassiicola Philippines]|uniref:Uncharacterized protein n=1 Tax=Corynespora cassiicola Philippines TaxID=1448308 RepID=A0A2T2PB51_CORCC|nr:hypothetical protein BS50DRAFT_567632 [Corynespora cassiicola Philippines]
MSEKPSSTRTSSSDTAVPTLSTRKSHHTSLKSALKKPFQGWTKEALWAREGLDDDYNFTSGKRRGQD